MKIFFKSSFNKYTYFWAQNFSGKKINWQLTVKAHYFIKQTSTIQNTMKIQILASLPYSTEVTLPMCFSGDKKLFLCVESPLLKEKKK